jgi:hypothetical protein
VLTTITVTPATATIELAGAQAFTAETLDQKGKPIAADVTWSVDGGGTVLPTAGATTTFTSDGTEGTFTVTAASGEVTGTAAATVQAPGEPTITVTRPNGGEDWLPGAVETISWDAQNVTGDADIHYSTDGGGSYTLIDTVPASDGSYQWTIPDEPGTHCRVRVQEVGDAGATDESDADFTIAAPGITVEPTFLEFDAMAGVGGVRRDTFKVKYEAATGGAVSVSVDRGDLPDYVSIDPTNFTLAPGATETVTVELDVPGLPPETSVDDRFTIVVSQDGAAGESITVDIDVLIEPSRVVTSCAPTAGFPRANRPGLPRAAIPYVLLLFAAFARCVVPWCLRKARRRP